MILYSSEPTIAGLQNLDSGFARSSAADSRHRRSAACRTPPVEHIRRGSSFDSGCSRFLRIVKTARCLKKSRGHRVELRLRRRRDDHAEVERVALELRLHRERLDLLDRVVGQKRLLGRLQDVLVLGAEVAARRVSAGGARARTAGAMPGPERTAERRSGRMGRLLGASGLTDFPTNHVGRRIVRPGRGAAGSL